PQLAGGLPPGLPPRRGGPRPAPGRHHQLQLRPHPALPAALPQHAPPDLSQRVASGRLPLGHHGPGLHALSGARRCSCPHLWSPDGHRGARAGLRGHDALAGASPMSGATLGEALAGGASAPEGVQAADWANARAVLAGEGDSRALDVELALATLEAAVLGRLPGPGEKLGGAPRKEVAKAARRALSRLRSAGVAVTEPERTGSSASEPAAAPETLPAFVTLPDGTGQRALLVATPRRGAIEL